METKKEGMVSILSMHVGDIFSPCEHKPDGEIVGGFQLKVPHDQGIYDMFLTALAHPIHH